MDLGIGELLDRFEKHFGAWPTKILMVVVALAVVGFCAATIVTTLIRPAIDLISGANTTFDWVDALRIAFTLLLGAAFISAWLDAYRIQNMRREYEETTSDAHEVLQDAHALSDQMSTSHSEFSVEYKDILSQLEYQIKKSKDLLSAAFLIIEYLYERAIAKTPLSDEEINSYKTMIDELKESEVV